MANSEPADGTEAPPTWGEMLKDLAVRAVVAVGASLGVAGLVAVLGAGILYARLTAIEVPADQALAVIENGELVVFGAVSSVLFVLLGLAAVTLVFLIDRGGEASPGMAVGLITLVALAMAWAVWAAPGVGDGMQLLLTGMLVVAWILGGLLSVVWAATTRRASALRRLVPAKHLDRLRASWWPIAVTLVIGELAVALAVALVDRVLGAQLVLAFCLGVALLRVAYLTKDRFTAYGIAVFVSVPVFAAIANAVRTFEDPLAQPAAVLRKGDPAGLCGLYVAETGKRVYLARTTLGGSRPLAGRGRLFWVPRDQITAMSVGDLQAVRRAVRRAPELSGELLRDRLAEAPAPATEKYRTTTTTTADGVKTVEVAEGTRPRTAPKPTLGTPEQKQGRKACVPAPAG